MHTHVRGGTNAGVKKMMPPGKSWRCHCPNPEGRTSRWKEQPGYRRNCPECWARRSS